MLKETPWSWKQQERRRITGVERTKMGRRSTVLRRVRNLCVETGIGFLGAERRIFNLRKMTRIPVLMKKYDIYTLTEQRRIGHLNPMVKQLMSHEEKKIMELDM